MCIHKNMFIYIRGTYQILKQVIKKQCIQVRTPISRCVCMIHSKNLIHQFRITNCNSKNIRQGFLRFNMHKIIKIILHLTQTDRKFNFRINLLWLLKNHLTNLQVSSCIIKTFIEFHVSAKMVTIRYVNVLYGK
ncbi:hypothetical protein VIGAN_11147300 [Vigna angularis var. angularis]|uniref:Uncharacterized protein n=1 Tax=Vigna angularis var. angularis TaxID=157739 RepID=A0A0S3TA04_PHAAN|nr:hypothetical protein VIGAN_11147300 [Vigna angularis var. angularis]